MRRLSRAFALLLLLSVPPVVAAQGKGKDAEEPTVACLNGAVQKVDRDTLTVQPRGASGRFEKPVALRITGTSRVTLLTTQKRGDKLVLAQKEVDAKDLQPGQSLTAIYATASPKEGPVLLSAVASPASGR